MEITGFPMQEQPVELFYDWVVGNNSSRTFSDDDVANAFRNSVGIVQARNDFYNKGICLSA